MMLYLHHGRKTPDESLDDWGANAPDIEGVKGIHQTYATAINVHFESAAAADAAAKLTGWEPWDDNALTMRWKDDLVHVRGPDGEMFYGDWGLI